MFSRKPVELDLTSVDTKWMKTERNAFHDSSNNILVRRRETSMHTWKNMPSSISHCPASAMSETASGRLKTGSRLTNASLGQ